MECVSVEHHLTLRLNRCIVRYLSHEEIVCVYAFVDHSFVILRSSSNADSILVSSLAWSTVHLLDIPVNLFLGALPDYRSPSDRTTRQAPVVSRRHHP